MYLSCTPVLYELAAEAYAKAACVEECLTAMAIADVLPHKHRELCMVMVAKLQNDHDEVKAARLLVDYLHDVESAIETLMNGQRWLEAMNIARAARRQDLVLTEVAYFLCFLLLSAAFAS